jgi:hypothetical protein
MSTTRRKFMRESEVAAVKRLHSGYPVGCRVAPKLEVDPNHLQASKRQFKERRNLAFSSEGRRSAEEFQIAKLERKIDQQARRSII